MRIAAWVELVGKKGARMAPSSRFEAVRMAEQGSLPHRALSPGTAPCPWSVSAPSFALVALPSRLLLLVMLSYVNAVNRILFGA
jgi:hypothetical protein